MKVQPKKIMCAVDFSDFTDGILAYSLALCKAFHAKLFLVHVAIDVNTFLMHSEVALGTVMPQDKLILNAQKRLGNLVKEMTIEHEIAISKGDPADEICRIALKERIDMVITATHGKSGIKRLLIGSVTEKLMKTLHCPLLVLHTQEHNFISQDGYEMKLRKILVGCDFSPDSKLAFDYGLSLAQEFKAELYLTHAIKPTEYIELKASNYIGIIPRDYVSWHTPDYFELQRRLIEEKREKINKLRSSLERQLYFMVPEESRSWCSPYTPVLTGEPYKELIKYAKEQEIDIIVLGIRGHTLWEKLLVGSTTDRIIRRAPCPVLAVRQMDAHS